MTKSDDWDVKQQANKYDTVSSKRYKLAFAPIEDSDQPTHPLLGALWLTKGPTFLQVEN